MDMASAPRLITGGLDGGQGVNIETSKRNGKVMASFAVDDNELMLVTNMDRSFALESMVVRGTPFDCQSQTQVCLFDVADDDNEKVVSAGLVRETDDDEEAASAGGEQSDGGGDLRVPSVSEMANEDIKGETNGRTDPDEDTPA